MLEKIRINPFENDTVTHPRNIAVKAVTGLNEEPLSQILRQWKELLDAPLPRRRRNSHTQFVVSPRPGYGKTHLIGRLFQELTGKASLVYLKPFANPASCWKAIMEKTIQELTFPEELGKEYSCPGDPSQLKVFSQGVIIRLILNTIKSGELIDPGKELKEHLDGATTCKQKQRYENRELLSGFTRKHASSLERELKSKGAPVYASPLTWLSILSVIASDPGQDDHMETCINWLTGSNVDLQKAKEIGIERNDIIPADADVNYINEACKRRILDLCTLAGYFRPFVFCFDQTENYGRDEALAKTLGTVVNTLMHKGFNQMTLLTANQNPWIQSIRPHWDKEHKGRMGIPQELEGLNINQGFQLISHRFEDLDPSAGESFMENKNRITDIFRDRKKKGTRDFLQACSGIWRRDAETASTLDTSFQKIRETLISQPRRFVFEMDILYWLTTEAARTCTDYNIEEADSRHKYFPVRWSTDYGEIYIGFEKGSHWKRWEAIAKESAKIFQASQDSHTLFFRTPEQQELPGANWEIAKEIREAMKSHLRIITIPQERLTDLYAAYDLYMETVGIPFSRKDVFACVEEKLAWFWTCMEKPQERMLPATCEKYLPSPLILEIREALSNNNIIGVEELLNNLSIPLTREQFHRLRVMIPEIKVHTGSSGTVLQWLG